MADHRVRSPVAACRSLACCLPLLALIACGGDDDGTPPPPATGGSGGAATGATGGSVTTTGSGGGGASTSGGGASAEVASGSATSGTGGGGDATGCTRDLLKSTIDAYFEALAAHDPSTLPLADDVKFTENSEALELGQGGLWKTAGALKYAHSALDTETCSSASQAVVPDGGMDIPLALRLKLESQKINEIETIAVRPGDYKVSGQDFASNTAALIASGDTVTWEEPVAAGDRSSRDELMGWMEKYFWLFPRGVCDTVSGCKRIENGGGSFNCSAGASCDPGQPGSGTPALTPRLIFADVETGIGVGFTMFMGNTDMHMFKMYGGQVYGVSAILGAASSSGWE
ncbi:hypothetical protein [Sorangium sp. So ce1153]|uniref:hypothetical protein n=1 Tax=Sorangium sp. So ce1153 TaxID=3133333 RepID=UPI003F631498